jgi:hypothetical protein
MGAPSTDYVSGSTRLASGPVEAVLDLKKHLVSVKFDTNNDGVMDAEIIGRPSSRSQSNDLLALLYSEAIARAADGTFTEQDVRSLGITARGIKSLNSGDC